MKQFEKAALVFLLRHLAAGTLGAALFEALLLYFDIGHLRTLLADSPNRILTIGLLFFGLFVTFGSVAMAIGVMSLGKDDN